MSFIERKSVNEQGAGVDLTPMLDVVFILLIFFIITAAFVREVSIDVNRPDASNHPSTSTESLIIDVSADNQLWVEGRSVDHRSLRALITRIHHSRDVASVLVRASHATQISAVVRAMDAARSAGIEQVSLVNNDDVVAQ